MREVRTEDAVGQVLCHDLTQIIPGVMKDARFRKEDIPVLLSIGKEHLYIWEKDDTMYHEDEAAEILCSLCMNEHMSRSQAKEGKIELRAEVDGLLKIDTELLDGVNGLGDMMIATLHPNMPVKKGDKICGTRVIPLVIKKSGWRRQNASAADDQFLRFCRTRRKKQPLSRREARFTTAELRMLLDRF